MTLSDEWIHFVNVQVDVGDSMEITANAAATSGSVLSGLSRSKSDTIESNIQFPRNIIQWL